MANKKMFTMVGIGEVLWDMLPKGKQLGGAPANFAYHVNQLGNKGVVVSCVGRDDNGLEILDRLQQQGVSHVITTADGYPTGVVGVKMSSKGIPSYTIHEGVAWDHLRLDERHRELARQADVVCYGTLAQRSADSAEAIYEFLTMTDAQCIRLFDINLRQLYYNRETIVKLLQLSTHLKLNDEELEIITQYLGFSGGETELLETLCKDYGLELIIVTKGQQGSRLFSQKMGDSCLQGETVKVVDTVGAGDSFAAAVATGLCLEMPLAKIHSLAEQVAGYVCQQAGATPALPPLKELLKEL